jgi:O-antigen ligase
LRGPNPFGGYLAVILSALTLRWYRSKPQQKQLGLFLIGLGVIALLFSFSRSAWVATLLAVGLGYVLHISAAARRTVLVSIAAVLVLVGSLVVVFRDNNVIENTVFHTDETNVASTSDEGHLAAIRAGITEVKNNPLGAGPGTAGPASYNLEKTAPRISENYYLQIAQEVGVIGLVLFILMFSLIMQRAVTQRLYFWPQVLLISGAGLAVANLLLHVWADDTLGIIWWALAGYYLYLPSKAQPN